MGLFGNLFGKKDKTTSSGIPTYEAIFIYLVIGIIFVWLLNMLGILNLLVGDVDVTTPIISTVKMVLIGVGLIGLVKVLFGSKSSNETLWFIIIVGVLVAIWMLIPSLLPGNMAVLAKSAQALIGLG